MHKTTTTTAASHFINPEPLTKRRIQEYNRQIHRIYTDKQGVLLTYEVVAQKTQGSAFGTLFTKGKHGGLFLRYCLVKNGGQMTKSLISTIVMAIIGAILRP